MDKKSKTLLLLIMQRDARHIYNALRRYTDEWDRLYKDAHIEDMIKSIDLAEMKVESKKAISLIFGTKE